MGLENASNDQYLTAVHGLKGAFIVAERGFLLGPSKNVSWNLFVGCFQEKCGFIVGFRGLQFDAFFLSPTRACIPVNNSRGLPLG